MDDFFGKRASMGLGLTMGGSDIDPAGMMFGGGGAMNRRGSMDSTTAALDAAIFDLTRRRYSMAGSLPGGNSVVGSSSLLIPSDRNAAAPFLDGHPGGIQDLYGSTANSNFDSTMGATGEGQRPTSLDLGGVVGGNAGSGAGPAVGAIGGTSSNALDYGDGIMPINHVMMQAQNGPSGNNMMNVNSGFLQQQQQARIRTMANTIAARQQQLQAQQRELESRQRELEHQRRELIASMQQRKLYMLRQQQQFENLVPQRQQVPNPNFNDSLSGSYRGVSTAGMMGVNNLSNNNTNNNSEHSSHGMPNMQNSGGGGSNTTSGGNQQWWICQVCNTKAFASRDEALVHETICAQVHPSNNRQVQQQQARFDQPFDFYNSSGVLEQQQSMVTPSTSNVVKSENASRSSPHTGVVKHSAGGMDSSVRTVHTSATVGTTHSYEPVYSTGPFSHMEKPVPLAMPTDKDWLTPLHCFVRKHCVEIFCATEADVAAPSKGKRKPIQVGQIGIRCPHCHPASPSMQTKLGQPQDKKESVASRARERGSVYYPTTISSIYNATMNLLQRHLHSCAAVPREVMSKYETLKSDDARSGTSKKYWIESALSLGLVDTEMGIRFSASTPPPLPQLTDSQKDMLRQIVDQTKTTTDDPSDESKLDCSNGQEEEPAPLTAPEDKSYSTAFSYQLLSQMKPCVFTEADRLGKRKGLPPGFPGLACRHCFGGYGSGRFFPSSIKTLSDTSKTLNVLHNHMIRCRKCPAAVRETLERLRGTHDEERSMMKFGSQKAFFARIWHRLHGTSDQYEQRHASNSANGKQQQETKKRKASASKKALTDVMMEEEEGHDDEEEEIDCVDEGFVKNTTEDDQMYAMGDSNNNNKRPRVDDNVTLGN